jgi:hypothetical protein
MLHRLDFDERLSRRLNHMRGLKVALTLGVLLVVAQYLFIYYNSSEFDYFVRHEAARTRSESQLKQSLLDQAREYSLPVKPSDISIDRTDAVVRVTVDYRVPLNLLVYSPELTFHVIGGGLLPAVQR